MASNNYTQGRGREFSTLYSVLKQDHVLKGARYYASKGICDIWWLTKDGKFNEAQVKSATKEGRKPRISKKELTRLKDYAHNNKGRIKVYLVLCPYKKRRIWKAMN